MSIAPVSGFGTAKWIVSATAGQGTHTTIAAALTAASSGDTIFIRTGTYTENPTLKAGVNLTAYNCDSANNVIILGKCTFTGAGTVSISGIQLKTNSDFCLAVTGSAASVVDLQNCQINANNNAGISYTSSSASSGIFLNYCSGAIGTTGIAFFTATGVGNFNFYHCTLNNVGASTTASSTSACAVLFSNCTLSIPTSTSSTGGFFFYNSSNDISAINTTALTTAGTGNSYVLNSYFVTGTASAISVGTGTTVTTYNTVINSSNTNAITGAGTLLYSNVSFSGSSYKINTTTETGGVAQGGLTQAPSAGFIGEQIRSAANISMSNGAAANITSISITAGVWDVSGLANFVFSGTATYNQLGISAMTGTIVGTQGDQFVQTDTASAGLSAPNTALSVPSWRLILTATTTYYLVGLADFSTGTCTAYGRISATRVG